MDMQGRTSDGVAPVIAVILIAALVVALAAVAAAIFMGMTSGAVNGMDTGFLHPTNDWDVIKVVYNGNGNTGGELPVDTGAPHDAGDSVLVADGSILTKNDYVFALWTMNADGSGDWYVAGESLTLNARTVLYAKWERKPVDFFVYYKRGGNRDAVISKLYDSAKKPDEITIIADPASGDESLKFKGWNTQQDGAGKAYSVGETYNGTKGSLTLYAQWEHVDEPEET